MFTDDSECLENNYCTKKIDAPIPCETCEFKNASVMIMCGDERNVWYSCKKGNPNCYYCKLSNMYQSCPLPKGNKEGCLIGVNSPACSSYMTELFHDFLDCSQNTKELESRVEKIEKAIFKSVEEKLSPHIKFTDGSTVVNSDTQKYELLKENAKLKETLQNTINDKETAQQLLEHYRKDKDELQSENTRLKAEIESLNALIVEKFKEYQKETSSIRYEWQSEVNKLIESKRDLQINYDSLLSELESIKKNQLSKEEIGLILNWFHIFSTIAYTPDKGRDKELFAKISSMVVEK